jgi:hypothetical protein
MHPPLLLCDLSCVFIRANPKEHLHYHLLMALASFVQL